MDEAGAICTFLNVRNKSDLVDNGHPRGAPCDDCILHIRLPVPMDTWQEGLQKIPLIHPRACTSVSHLLWQDTCYKDVKRYKTNLAPVLKCSHPPIGHFHDQSKKHSPQGLPLACVLTHTFLTKVSQNSNLCDGMMCCYLVSSLCLEPLH